MTLILSCLMRDQIVQVSDRRLSLLVGKTVIPVEDDSNKAVVYPGLVFGYTGLARIGNKNAAAWLEGILWEAWPETPPSQSRALFSLIASSASSDFAAMPYSDEHKRHAFVALGWLPTREQDSIDRWKPTAVTISNFQDANGRWLPKAQKEFTVTAHELLARESSHLSVVGVDIGTTQTDVARLLRQCARKKTSPMLVARILTSAVRSVASRCPAVGGNLMIVSVPRSAVRKHPRPMFFTMGSPNTEIGTATYLPKDLPLASEEIVQYGPPVIGSWSRIEVRPLPDDDVPPPPEPLSAIILTDRRLVKDYYGDDLWEMGVCEDHPGKRRRWTDLTGQSPKPMGYTHPHPYYGMLVGLTMKLPDDTIDEIIRDDRHLVVISAHDDETRVPDAEWFERLREWLLSHAMPAAECDVFCARIRQLPRGQTIGALHMLLCAPVPHLDRPIQQASDS